MNMSGRWICMLLCSLLPLAGCQSPYRQVWGAQVEGGHLNLDLYTSENALVSFRVPFEMDGYGFSSMQIRSQFENLEGEIIITSRALPAEVYRVMTLDHSEEGHAGVGLEGFVLSMYDMLEAEYGRRPEPGGTDRVSVGEMEAERYSFTMHVPRRRTQVWPPLWREGMEVTFAAYALPGEACTVFMMINWPVDGDKLPPPMDARYRSQDAVDERVLRFLTEFTVHC